MGYLSKSFMSLIAVLVLLAGIQSPLFAAKNDQPAAQAPKTIGVDTDGDGKPDRWEYYEATVLVRIEADTNNDGKVDEKAIVKDGKIISAEKDSNYDGKVDRWINY